MKVRVDRSLCVGFGRCVETDPNVFKLDNESKAVVIGTDTNDALLEAARSCPVDAVIVEDDQGKQVYP